MPLCDNSNWLCLLIKSGLILSLLKIKLIFQKLICSAFEFTPTLLVNKFIWSYHKVALDLWGSRIWLNVSIFYQFHKAKSRYLSSEPGHWFKKQLSKFSWNQSKDLTFAQIFAFCDLNVIFDNSNWIECVYILKCPAELNSGPVHLQYISIYYLLDQELVNPIHFFIPH